MDKRKRKNRYFIMKPKKIAVGKNELTAIAMYLVFSSGLMLGAVLINKSAGASPLYLLCEKLFNLRQQQSAVQIFCTALLRDLSFIVVSILLGYSALGSVFTFALSFIKGTVISLMLTYLCTAYKLKGLGYAALIIIPPQIISTLALIFSLIKSISFSIDILEKGLIALSKCNENKAAAYIKIQGLMICTVCAAALAEALLTSLMSSFFGI